MKKMFKKSLSLLLAVLMVISVITASTLMSASASAASLGYADGKETCPKEPKSAQSRS